MSSYIHFFVRKENTFVPIGTFCRSNQIYQIFNYYAPYEAIAPITISMMNGRLLDLKEEVEALHNRYTSYDKMIETIIKMDNPVEEKLDSIEGYNESKDEIKEVIEEKEWAMSYIEFLVSIIENIKYDDEYNPDKFIYAGVECGDSITIDMVKGE